MREMEIIVIQIQIVRNYTVTEIRDDLINLLKNDAEDPEKDYNSCFHCGEPFEVNSECYVITIQELKLSKSPNRVVCPTCANLIRVKFAQEAEVSNG